MSNDQLRDLNRRWTEAELHADAAALDPLVTDDFVGIGPFGFVLTRAQWLERFAAGALKVEAFTLDDLTVREFGDTIVGVGVMTQKAAYQGQDSSGRYRFTEIAVRRDGELRLAEVQYSGPIPNMPPGRA